LKEEMGYGMYFLNKNSVFLNLGRLITDESLYYGARFRNHEYRKEELRKGIANFTYKSIVGTIFRN
jgi:hypothetical protein